MDPDEDVAATVAYIEALWFQLGGDGDAPPLIVSQATFDAAVARGFPTARMKVAPLFPEDDA